MTDERAPFLFSDAPLALDPGADARVVQVPADVESKQALLEQLDERLELPDYFGGNWDALMDCLRDLEWVAERRVVLVHAALPGLPEGDLRVYLEVLRDAVLDWRRPGQAHELAAVFASSDAPAVRGLLGVSGGPAAA